MIRPGPALGCNYCWNTIDSHGRILRRKTKYHCPECQMNLCIVPCFQEYHERRNGGDSGGRQQNQTTTAAITSATSNRNNQNSSLANQKGSRHNSNVASRGNLLQSQQKQQQQQQSQGSSLRTGSGSRSGSRSGSIRRTLSASNPVSEQTLAAGAAGSDESLSGAHSSASTNHSHKQQST